MLQKFRIAISVLCGVVCVCLLVLWVRSYRTRDMTRGCILGSSFHINFISLNGGIGLAFDQWRGTPHPWIVESNSDPVNMVSQFPAAIGKPPLSWFGFRWLRNPTLFVFIMPHWFPILLCGAFAILPWQRWWYRFRVRTLLIITMLVALICGYLTIV